jgi:3-deoxy-D-manno-octulosonic-acid transferase
MVQGLFNSKAFASTAGALMAAYIRLIRRTSSMRDDPPDFVLKNLPDHPLIIAMWHGQGLLLPYIRPRDDIKVAIMVARHIDGDIVHETLDRFGMTTIRGAGAGRKGKDKGGFAALRSCMKAIRNDTTVALTADIPPGPARKAGMGLIVLSMLSGRAIMPCAVVTNHYLKLNTWSGFTVNLPFSKMVMTGGEQIRVPRHASDAELEAARQLLEESMNEITERAYRLAGTSERGIASDGKAVAYGPMLRTYMRATRLFQPAAPLLLGYRQRQGKEEGGRTDERLGIASAQRLPGPLVWLHAASVGETITILYLIEKLMRKRPDLQILLTTGTVTSANLARDRLPEEAIHQYVPLDTPDFMTRFFDHWRPSVAILTESEIWPNLIQEARTRKVPLLLVNGRISPRSFRRWRGRFKIARPLFSSLDLVLAQNERYASNFERLGARNVQAAGNLKMDAPPPPADKAALRRLKKAIGSRPVFLAASTHPGEEEIIAGVHRALKKDMPDLLTIIVPRHPNRGAEICDLIQGEGLNCTQRTSHDAPSGSVDIYVADTIGELGLFYAVSPVAFVGGSLVLHGGQNPIEAIMHKTAVLTGPNVHNFEEAYTTLLNTGACIEVATRQDLTEQARMLFRDEKARKELLTRAQAELDEMRGALDTTLNALEAYLPGAKEKRRAS